MRKYGLSPKSHHRDELSQHILHIYKDFLSFFSSERNHQTVIRNKVDGVLHNHDGVYRVPSAVRGERDDNDGSMHSSLPLVDVASLRETSLGEYGT